MFQDERDRRGSPAPPGRKSNGKKRGCSRGSRSRTRVIRSQEIVINTDKVQYKEVVETKKKKRQSSAQPGSSFARLHRAPSAMNASVNIERNSWRLPPDETVQVGDPRSKSAQVKEVIPRCCRFVFLIHSFVYLFNCYKLIICLFVCFLSMFCVFRVYLILCFF